MTSDFIISKYGPAVEAKVQDLIDKGVCTISDLAQAKELMENSTEAGMS